MADIIFPGEEPVDTLGIEKLPTNMDLTFWQGDKVEYIFQFQDSGSNPVNLAGTTPTAVIRQGFDSPTLYSIQCTIQGVSNNQVRIYLSSPVSKTIEPGDYVWNFQIAEPGGDVRTYFAGDVTVLAEVDN